MKMYVHVPYIYVLGTVRQCKEDFVTVQLPCKPTYTWYIPVKALSRQTLCRRYAAKDHILFNQNEKHDFNQILAYHFRIPAYHTTRFLIRIMSYTGIIPVNIPHCSRHSARLERAERTRKWGRVVIDSEDEHTLGMAQSCRRKTRIEEGDSEWD